jgi:hypothetical protein
VLFVIIDYALKETLETQPARQSLELVDIGGGGI